MPTFEERGGYRPKLQEHADGSIDIPDGFDQLTEDLVRYRVGGKHKYLHIPTKTWMRGVTTILRNEPMEEGLLRWICSHGSYDAYMAALSEAGLRGTQFHRAAERYADGQELRERDYTEEVWRHLFSFDAWWNQFKPECAAIEQPVYDLRRQIATCIDFRGVIDGKHTTLNYKTSKSGIMESAVVQSNEEAVLYNGMEQFDDLGPVVQHGVLRTNTLHKSTYEFVLFEIDQARHEYFEHLDAIDRYHSPDVTPIFPKEYPETLHRPDRPPEPAASEHSARNGNGRAAKNGRE